jgi:predicted nucleic acid-binding protein
MATRAADLTAVPDRVMLDANVLLAATDEGRAEHRDALTVVNDGLGLSLPDALGNVRAIRERTTLLAEDSKVTDRLLGLLADVECRGRQIHDANVVATMLVYGIGAVVTINVRDFARFGGHVDLIRL